VRGFAPVVRSSDVGKAPRYLLVTQCLQNDFFQNADCRLGLPDFVVREMLLGTNRLHTVPKTGRRTVSRAGLRRARPQELARSEVEGGPLGRLLAKTIFERASGLPGHEGILHVINIRDWHDCTSSSYDAERRVYGRHCEASTWGAGYISGLAHYLDPHLEPDAAVPKTEAVYFAKGSVRVYHVHSDTLFDFKPHAATTSRRRKYRASELEDYLDIIVEGSNEELDDLHDLLEQKPPPKPEDVHKFVVKAVKSVEPWHPRVHLAVIGVYTDIKIKTLLTGLRTRYDLNVAVSDTFATSPTLERHLAGLDYAKKVLGIEVIHGINDLVHFLGGAGAEEVPDESSLVGAESYSTYERFFQDQQNVLAYQNQRLQDYITLTEHRAVRLYQTINFANRFLLLWGGLFLAASLVFTVLSAIWPHRFDWKFSAITGGLGIAQFVGVFFTKPTKDLHHNLTNLAGFKMVLESHALKTAIMRFHLTTPRTLQPIENDDHAAAARLQIDMLDRELKVIGQADAADFEHLEALGFHDPDRAAAQDKRNGSGGSDGEAPSAAQVRDEGARAKARSPRAGRPSPGSHA
jgi:hypothetical protein